MKITKKVIKNILGKKKKKKDWDGDGVPDWKDCQPRNTMRQDTLSKMGYMRLRQIGNKTTQPQQQMENQKVVMSPQGETFVLKKDIKNKIY